MPTVGSAQSFQNKSTESPYDFRVQSCPVCRGPAGKIHTAREMMMGTAELFAYAECESCGCLWLTEVPREMGRYYPAADYYSLQASASNRVRMLRDRVYLSRWSWLVNWHSRTDLDVIRRAGLRKSMNLLDVGCGVGYLLRDLRDLGYQAEGIDPFIPEDIHDRFGVRVRRQRLDEVSETYDVILFRHSLEHMPIHSLRQARERIRNNGVCVVCIPIIGWAWANYGVNWVQLDAPRHLFLHSAKSLALLASASQFRVERIVYDSTDFQFWGSEAYSREIPLNRASRPRLRERIRLLTNANRLNGMALGDSAQFYLRPV